MTSTSDRNVEVDLTGTSARLPILVIPGAVSHAYLSSASPFSIRAFSRTPARQVTQSDRSIATLDNRPGNETDITDPRDASLERPQTYREVVATVIVPDTFGDRESVLRLMSASIVSLVARSVPEVQCLTPICLCYVSYVFRYVD